MEKVPKPRFQGRKRMRIPGYDYSSDGLYFVTIDCNNRECRFGHILRGRMILNDFGRIAEEEWLKLPARFSQVRLHVFQIMPNHMHGIIELRNNCVQVGLAPTDSKNQGEISKSSNVNSNQNYRSRKNRVQVGLAPTIGNNQVEDGKPSIENSNQNYRSRKNRVQVGLAPTEVRNQNAVNSLSDIVGAYKSLVAVACIRCHKKKHSQENPTPVLGKIWKRGYYDRIIRDETNLHIITRYIQNNPLRWTMN